MKIIGREKGTKILNLSLIAFTEKPNYWHLIYLFLETYILGYKNALAIPNTAVINNKTSCNISHLHWARPAMTTMSVCFFILVKLHILSIAHYWFRYRHGIEQLVKMALNTAQVNQSHAT